jgi:hypothetical protein
MTLLAGWAQPVDLDEPRPPPAFSADDPFAVRTIDPNDPPNLVKEHQPPFIDRDVAADFRWLVKHPQGPQRYTVQVIKGPEAVCPAFVDEPVETRRSPPPIAEK